jgi:glycosyltransferase involved in cell wall biosynthesis
MKRPLLSVVIPTWNRARLVCQAIGSALIQQQDGVEVIVVDDGSEDDTAVELNRRFGSRIRLLRVPSRRGISAARNLGVSHARGEFLAFLDSDDIWLPGKLEAELRIFRRFPSAQAVVSDCMTFQEGQPNAGSRFETNGLLAACKGQVKRLSDCRWLWGHWNNTLQIGTITLRRSVLRSLKEPLFSEDLVSGEDWEFEMHVYQGCRVVVLPEIWSYIRRFDDGSRPGRACPGKPLTRIQRLSILRDKLTILGRTLRLEGLKPEIANEILRCQCLTAKQFANVAHIEG